MAEWIAYYGIEPFGERAEWLRTGVLASVIANTHRSKSSKLFTPEDFMPRFEEKKVVPKQSVDEQRAALTQIYDYAKKHGLTKKG